MSKISPALSALPRQAGIAAVLLSWLPCWPPALAAELYTGRPEAFQVRELDVSRQYVQERQRERVRRLLGSRLGVTRLHGDRRDLPVLQQLVDRRLIEPSDLAGWQAVGVLLGDVIAREAGLRWVTVEDELGVSRALQWRGSQNFVFPVTLLSRRMQFNRQVDVQAIFAGVLDEVANFRTRVE